MSNKNIINFIKRAYYLMKLRRIARTTGFQIPPFVFGKGLTIWHWGTIIVNAKAKIGNYCTIQPQVVIGWNEKTKEAPSIGDNVTIFGGSFIYGGIKIGNNVTIGCNSFVNSDIPDNCFVAGSPAKIIKKL